jgi:nitroimidazol reductase NimA-like FMN-containing flavoprotein (pyridoxamine 5'-phosphate oxidase superfamily)
MINRNVVPIFFYLEPQENCLYSFSTLGRKVQWMRANPQVCVEVDEVNDRRHWTTVVVFGRFEEIRDPAQHGKARERAAEPFVQRSEWWLPGIAKLAAGKEHPIPVVYRIHITRMTGRRTDRPERKQIGAPRELSRIISERQVSVSDMRHSGVGLPSEEGHPVSCVTSSAASECEGSLALRPLAIEGSKLHAAKVAVFASQQAAQPDNRPSVSVNSSAPVAGFSTPIAPVSGAPTNATAACLLHIERATGARR